MLDRLFARFLAFVYGTLGLALMGCHDLSPQQAEAYKEFQCEVAVLERFVEPTLDAAQLARAAYLGQADLRNVVRVLGMTQGEVAEMLEGLHACQTSEDVAPVPPLPQPEELEQSRLVAPPPAYGNKIL